MIINRHKLPIVVIDRLVGVSKIDVPSSHLKELFGISGVNEVYIYNEDQIKAETQAVKTEYERKRSCCLSDILESIIVIGDFGMDIPIYLHYKSTLRDPVIEYFDGRKCVKISQDIKEFIDTIEGLLLV